MWKMDEAVSPIRQSFCFFFGLVLYKKLITWVLIASLYCGTIREDMHVKWNYKNKNTSVKKNIHKDKACPEGANVHSAC